MRALIIVLVALLAACANLAGLSQKPEVSLAGLKLTQLGLFEQRFSLQLRSRTRMTLTCRSTD